MAISVPTIPALRHRFSYHVVQSSVQIKHRDHSTEVLMGGEALLGKIPKGGEQWRVFPFAITIFLSAFLLFQVELILSKYLLPWFGGSASVWTTSMLVFQTLLFAGYAYAHAVSTRLQPPSQFRFHMLLIAASVAALAISATTWPSPLTPGGNWKPLNADHPVVNVIGLLLASVGAPVLCVVEHRSAPPEMVYV